MGAGAWAVDTESDGLEDADEITIGTNPALADTDGIPDGDESTRVIAAGAMHGDDGVAVSFDSPRPGFWQRTAYD